MNLRTFCENLHKADEPADLDCLIIIQNGFNLYHHELRSGLETILDEGTEAADWVKALYMESLKTEAFLIKATY